MSKALKSRQDLDRPRLLGPRSKRAEVSAYKFTQLLAGRKHLENNSVTWTFISLKELFFEEQSLL